MCSITPLFGGRIRAEESVHSYMSTSGTEAQRFGLRKKAKVISSRQTRHEQGTSARAHERQRRVLNSTRIRRRSCFITSGLSLRKPYHTAIHHHNACFLSKPSKATTTPTGSRPGEDEVQRIDGRYLNGAKEVDSTFRVLRCHTLELTVAPPKLPKTRSAVENEGLFFNLP